MLRPEAVIGRVITDVAASWYERHGVRAPDPVHVWLVLDGLGPVMAATTGSGLRLTLSPVHGGIDMQQDGRIIVEHSGLRVLDACLGRRVEAMEPVRQDPPGMAVGWMLRLAESRGDTQPLMDVVIADTGDDFLIATWPLDTSTPGDVGYSLAPHA